MAHAVGLDAPESTIEALNVLRDRGYAIANVPADGAALIDRLKTETIHWPLATLSGCTGRPRSGTHSRSRAAMGLA